MLSVIIVSYNTRDITLRCLKLLAESLFELKRCMKMSAEVIVVDNASTDGSAEAIKKQYPRVKLIEMRENTGFAKGNNVGMKKSLGDWILLLNSDVFLEKKTISESFEFAKNHQQADIIGCKLLNRDGSLQASYGYFPNLYRLGALMFFIDNLPVVRNFFKSIHIREAGRYASPVKVDWVTGAWVLLKRQVYEKTSGIDEKYFMYGEEMEWMYRAAKKGFSVWFVPAGKCIHLGGASTNNLSRMYASEIKGYLYWYKKHEPVWKLFCLKTILISGAIFKSLVWRLTGNPVRARANWAAMKEVLR